LIGDDFQRLAAGKPVDPGLFTHGSSASVNAGSGPGLNRATRRRATRSPVASRGQRLAACPPLPVPHPGPNEVSQSQTIAISVSCECSCPVIGAAHHPPAFPAPKL
jgi:hypothetical protein